MSAPRRWQLGRLRPCSVTGALHKDAARYKWRVKRPAVQDLPWSRSVAYREWSERVRVTDPRTVDRPYRWSLVRGANLGAAALLFDPRNYGEPGEDFVFSPSLIVPRATQQRNALCSRRDLSDMTRRRRWFVGWTVWFGRMIGSRCSSIASRTWADKYRRSGIRIIVNNGDCQLLFNSGVVRWIMAERL